MQDDFIIILYKTTDLENTSWKYIVLSIFKYVGNWRIKRFGELINVLEL